MGTILNWIWVAIVWLAGWIWAAIVWIAGWIWVAIAWLAGWIWAPFGWAAEFFVGNYWIVGSLVALLLASGIVNLMLLLMRSAWEQALSSRQRDLKLRENEAILDKQRQVAKIRELRERLNKSPDEIRRENNQLRAVLGDKEQLVRKNRDLKADNRDLMREIEGLRADQRGFIREIKELREQGRELIHDNHQWRQDNRRLRDDNSRLRDDLRRRRR